MMTDARIILLSFATGVLILMAGVMVLGRVFP